jgi:hypothetical protein
MSFWTPDEVVKLRSLNAVRYVMLAQLDFLTAPSIRLFNGVGILDTEGHEWYGIRSVSKIDGLADQRGMKSNPVSIVLSGVDPQLLPLALQDTEEVDQQPIAIFFKFLNEDLQPIGRLVRIFSGLMQPPKIDRPQMSEKEGSLCTITITAENYLIGKSKPPNGRYTDRDQQKMFPGDLFFNRVSENKNKTIVWPDY